MPRDVHEKLCRQTPALYALFLLSFGLMLLNQGMFWDDWTLLHLDAETRVSIFRQVGAPAVGWLHATLLSVGEYGVSVYRFLILVSYLFSSVLMLRLLIRIPALTNTERTVLVLIFTVFPVNATRITLITTPYALTSLFFWVALTLMSKAVEQKSLFCHGLAVVFFFLSFQMNSLLVFYYPIVMALLVFGQPALFATRPELVKTVRRLSPYIFLPVAFWLLRTWLMPPNGLYSEYNRVSAESLVLAPVGIIKALYSSFFVVIGDAFVKAIRYPLVTLMASGIAFWQLWECRDRADTMPPRRSLCVITSGVVLFAAAVFSYVAVGNIPDSSDWNSRHQILVPLGAALMLLGSLSFLLGFGRLRTRPWVHVAAQSLLIGAFVSLNVSTCLDFQKDWFKQRSIIANLRMNDIVRNHTTFLFSDEAPEMNAQGRSYRFYEYSAFMREAFGEDTRLGCDIKVSEWLPELAELVKHKQFGFAHYVPGGPVIRVHILPKRSPMSDVDVFVTLIDCLLDRERCDETITDIVRIEASPMSE